MKSLGRSLMSGSDPRYLDDTPGSFTPFQRLPMGSYTTPHNPEEG